VKPGDQVTWGSGAPLAQVLEVHLAEISVVLLKDVTTPRGKVWRAGLELTIPKCELRRVN
jgi:hypothetical protein